VRGSREYNREWAHVWTAPKTDGVPGLHGLGALPERLLLCASDLSTRRQRNGHAMVTTGERGNTGRRPEASADGEPPGEIPPPTSAEERVHRPDGEDGASRPDRPAPQRTRGQPHETGRGPRPTCSGTSVAETGTARQSFGSSGRCEVIGSEVNASVRSPGGPRESG